MGLPRPCIQVPVLVPAASTATVFETHSFLTCCMEHVPACINVTSKPQLFPERVYVIHVRLVLGVPESDLLLVPVLACPCRRRSALTLQTGPLQRKARSSCQEHYAWSQQQCQYQTCSIQSTEAAISTQAHEQAAAAAPVPAADRSPGSLARPGLILDSRAPDRHTE
jgi:hypothetical protein